MWKLCEPFCMSYNLIHVCWTMQNLVQPSTDLWNLVHCFGTVSVLSGTACAVLYEDGLLLLLYLRPYARIGCMGHHVCKVSFSIQVDFPYTSDLVCDCLLQCRQDCPIPHNPRLSRACFALSHCATSHIPLRSAMTKILQLVPSAEVTSINIKTKRLRQTKVLCCLEKLIMCFAAGCAV